MSKLTGIVFAVLFLLMSHAGAKPAFRLPSWSELQKMPASQQEQYIRALREYAEELQSRDKTKAQWLLENLTGAQALADDAEDHVIEKCPPYSAGMTIDSRNAECALKFETALGNGEFGKCDFANADTKGDSKIYCPEKKLYFLLKNYEFDPKGTRPDPDQPKPSEKDDHWAGANPPKTLPPTRLRRNSLLSALNKSQVASAPVANNSPAPIAKDAGGPGGFGTPKKVKTQICREENGTTTCRDREEKPNVPATEKTKNWARCFYAGFSILSKGGCQPVRGSLCQANSKLVTIPSLETIAKLVCENESDAKGQCPNTPPGDGQKSSKDVVVCNPLLYGVNDQGAVYCVARGSKASENCGQKSSDISRVIEFLQKKDGGKSFDEMLAAIQQNCGVWKEAAKPDAEDPDVDQAAEQGGWNTVTGKSDMKSTCGVLKNRVSQLKSGTAPKAEPAAGAKPPATEAPGKR